MCKNRLYLCVTHYTGGPESDGPDECRHTSERRPEHTPARERLHGGHPYETGGADSQHCAHHPLQVRFCHMWMTGQMVFVLISSLTPADATTMHRGVLLRFGYGEEVLKLASTVFVTVFEA